MLCFYTGNCDLIGEVCVDNDVDSIESGNSTASGVVTMKSLCFSNHTEGKLFWIANTEKIFYIFNQVTYGKHMSWHVF